MAAGLVVRTVANLACSDVGVFVDSFHVVGFSDCDISRKILLSSFKPRSRSSPLLFDFFWRVEKVSRFYVEKYVGNCQEFAGYFCGSKVSSR